MSHPDVLVLGGGIIGLTCAREMAARGLKVELLERRPAGSEASLAAAGMLAPLSESPSAGPLFFACREARDLWTEWLPELVAESGLTVGYDASGTFAMALEPEDDGLLNRVAQAARTLGEPCVEVAPGDLRRAVPDIAPTVRRALLLAGEHRVDNVQACAALTAAAARRGVVLRYGVAVSRVERLGSSPARGGRGERAKRSPRDAGAEDPAAGEATGQASGRVRLHTTDGIREAALLVLAAGAWSGAIAGLPTLPVHPVRGQMVRISGVAWPWQGSVRGAHSYVVRRGTDGLLIGATVEEAGFAAHPTAAGIAGLLGFVRRAFPGLERAPLEGIWAGLRPGTRDHLPLIGPLPGWPVLVAAGHFRNGILLAPWTARHIARLAASHPRPTTAPELAAFAPDRFPPERLPAL